MGKTGCTIQTGLGFITDSSSGSAQRLMLALGIIGLTVVSQPLFAKDVAQDDDAEVDPVALASVLIHDKHFDRAKLVLEEVNIKDPKLDINRPRYFLLLGLTYLELQEHEKAAGALEMSAKSGQKDKIVYVFLAQARFHMGDFKGAILATQKAREAAETLPGVFLLTAQSYWRSDDRAAAYETFSRGIKKFPNDDALRKNRVLLLVDMGLYQQAVTEGMAYLSQKEDAKGEEYVAFSEALIKAKRYEDAVILLETARLRYSEDKDIVIQLARAYMEGGHLFIAARLFEHASRITPELTLDAAELYRRAGRLPPAVRLNEKVADQKSKIRQRLGLLIELERFEEAASLESRLTRLGLMDEDAVRYGLAYAYFMTGRFEQAEVVLKLISDPAFFEKSIQLRKIMGSCAKSGWQCL